MKLYTDVSGLPRFTGEDSIRRAALESCGAAGRKAAREAREAARRERKRASDREYKARPEVKERTRAWRKEHRDEINAYKRARRAEFPERAKACGRAYNRAYYAEHKEGILARQKEWRRKKKEEG